MHHHGLGNNKHMGVRNVPHDVLCPALQVARHLQHLQRGRRAGREGGMRRGKRSGPRADRVLQVGEQSLGSLGVCKPRTSEPLLGPISGSAADEECWRAGLLCTGQMNMVCMYPHTLTGLIEGLARLGLPQCIPHIAQPLHKCATGLIPPSPGHTPTHAPGRSLGSIG